MSNRSATDITDRLPHKPPYSAPEAARVAGVSAARAQQYARWRGLTRVGGSYLFDIADIEDLIARKLRPGNPSLGSEAPQTGD